VGVNKCREGVRSHESYQVALKNVTLGMGHDASENYDLDRGLLSCRKFNLPLASCLLPLASCHDAFLNAQQLIRITADSSPLSRVDLKGTEAGL
jgi:hypothetical protein